MINLNGKVAVITGGNTGLGFAYSKALAAFGADILVAGHTLDFDEIKEVVESFGRKFHYVRVDLLNDLDINKVVDEAVLLYGKIDILVNNAGMIKRSPILEHSYSDFEMVLNLNLTSVFKLSQKVAIEMRKQGGGKIINIASMLSYQGGKFVPGYTASKHGVSGITKAFANELAVDNIQVNAVAPGYVVTENTKEIRSDALRNKEILDRIPAGYWANPDDIAGTVCFLASSLSDYVNGVTIAVDGGWQAR